MNLALVLLWLLPSVASPAKRLHVDLDGYELTLPQPSGWSAEKTDTDGISLERPGVFITLDWYTPRRGIHYDDFDRRVDSEIRSRREDHSDVHVRRFRIGRLHAVEVRFLDHDRIFAETYIGVPRKPSGGELFMVTLEGHSGSAAASDLRAYHRVLDAIHITSDEY